ncbi:MAG: PEGA domain-containing protein, partial [Myxococcota bacterium]
RRLFTGESDFEILSKVIRDPIPRPSDIVPDVDPELEQICIRTLERDRDRRWRDGMEMEEALTNWMRARGVDHTNTGLDRFVQSVFGRANHPLPTPGVSSTPHSKQDEMALAAAMPTAMLTPGMLPEESPSNNSAPPSDDPNMQRTMALDMPPSPSGPPPTAQNSDDRTAIFDLDSAPSDLGLGGYDDPSPPPPQPATDYGSDSQKHERTAVFNALDHDLGPPPGHPARPPSPPPTNWFNIALIGAIFGVLGLTLCVIAVGAIMLEPDLLGESKPAVASSKGKKNKGKKSKGRKSKTRKTSPKKGSEDSAQAKTKDDSKKSDSAAAQAKKTPTPNDKTTSKDDGKADTPKDDDKATARIDEKDTPKDKPAEDKPKAQDKGTSDDRDTTSNTTADTSQDHASKNDVTKGDTPKGDTPKGDTNKTDTNKDDTPQANGKSGDQGDTATATKATDSTPSSNDSNTTDKPQENGLATITIKATPWADVFLDGRRLGRTPISRVEVAPGKHVVLFKNEDLRKKKRKDIEVASGENAQVSHEFK